MACVVIVETDLATTTMIYSFHQPSLVSQVYPTTSRSFRRRSACIYGTQSSSNGTFLKKFIGRTCKQLDDEEEKKKEISRTIVLICISRVAEGSSFDFGIGGVPSRFSNRIEKRMSGLYGETLRPPNENRLKDQDTHPFERPRHDWSTRSITFNYGNYITGFRANCRNVAGTCKCARFLRAALHKSQRGCMPIPKQLSDNRVKDLVCRSRNKITEIEYKLGGVWLRAATGNNSHLTFLP